jgi:hypothetical protein
LRLPQSVSMHVLRRPIEITAHNVNRCILYEGRLWVYGGRAQVRSESSCFDAFLKI